MKPKLLVECKDLSGYLFSIDYIELMKLPYDFRKLRRLLIENTNKFSMLVDQLSLTKNYSTEEIESFKSVIEAVKEMNADYIEIKKEEWILN